MTEQVTRETWVEAPAAAVWDVVVADGWLAERVELDLTPGGEAGFTDGDEHRTGWVEDAVAPSRLALWWASGDEPASRVEITLEERDGRTRVCVTEARPLDRLDLLGVPLRGAGRGATYGPALLAA